VDDLLRKNSAFLPVFGMGMTATIRKNRSAGRRMHQAACPARSKVICPVSPSFTGHLLADFVEWRTGQETASKILLNHCLSITALLRHASTSRSVRRGFCWTLVKALLASRRSAPYASKFAGISSRTCRKTFKTSSSLPCACAGSSIPMITVHLSGNIGQLGRHCPQTVITVSIFWSVN